MRRKLFNSKNMWVPSRMKGMKNQAGREDFGHFPGKSGNFMNRKLARLGKLARVRERRSGVTPHTHHACEGEEREREKLGKKQLPPLMPYRSSSCSSISILFFFFFFFFFLNFNLFLCSSSFFLLVLQICPCVGPFRQLLLELLSSPHTLKLIHGFSLSLYLPTFSISSLTQPLPLLQSQF